MRILFCFVFILFTGSSVLSQSNGVPVNKAKNNSSEELELEEISQPDSSAVIIEQLESKKVKTGKEAKKEQLKIKSSYDLDDQNAEPVTENLSTISSNEYRSASYSFDNSKEASSTQRQQRSPSFVQQVEMDQAVGYFEATAPESFECNYYTYVAGNYDVSLVESLNKAENLRPDNSDVHVQKAAYNMIVQDDDESLKYLELLIRDERLEDDLNYYAEDLLLSVPDSGLLITHGFDDTYSTMYKQLKDNVREDVTIVSLDFMQSEQFRSNLKEKGVSLPARKTIDVDYLQEFCELNEDLNVSLSLTTPKEYFEPIKESLYVVGLVFEYHEKSFDNFHRNDDLWNNGLKKHLVFNSTEDKTKILTSNYLPMLLVLYQSYKDSGQLEKFAEIDEASDKVSVQCEKYEQVNKLKGKY